MFLHRGGWIAAARLLALTGETIELTIALLSSDLKTEQSNYIEQSKYVSLFMHEMQLFFFMAPDQLADQWKVELTSYKSVNKLTLHIIQISKKSCSRELVVF